MGAIRKIGDTYYVEFYARGLMYSQPAGFSLETAERLLKEIEDKIAGGEALTVERYIDLPVFFEQFLNSISSEFSVKTICRFRDLIVHFIGFLKSAYPHITRLSEITPSVCESYKKYLSKSYKPALVNFSILLLREVMEYGIKIGFINDNPTVHVKLLPWGVKKVKLTVRYNQIKDLFAKGIDFGRVYKISRLTDIAQMLYYSNLIPRSREDMYN